MSPRPCAARPAALGCLVLREGAALVVKKVYSQNIFNVPEDNRHGEMAYSGDMPTCYTTPALPPLATRPPRAPALSPPPAFPRGAAGVRAPLHAN